MKKRQTLIHQALKYLVAMEGFTVEPLEETTTAATASAPAEEKIGVEVEVSSFDHYMCICTYVYHMKYGLSLGEKLVTSHPKR